MKTLILTLAIVLIAPTAHAKRTPSPDGKYNPEILERVLTEVQKTAQAGKRPVVIFDLDETLVNSRTRTLKILRDFAKLETVKRRFNKESETILKLTKNDATIEKHALTMRSYGLYPDEILKELGAYSDAFHNEIKKTYVDTYLSNAYCMTDVPMPGAVEYTKAISQAGAHIVYLTGRNRPGMGLCTDENLILKNYVFGDPTKATLMMKPTLNADDTDFKVQAMNEVAKLGTVVAGFENEPANLNAFKTAFPEGTYIFIDSMHSNRADVPHSGAVYIKDYKRLKQAE